MIGRTLVRTGEGWSIQFGPEETKTGTSLELTWPETLVPMLEANLAVHRLVVAGFWRRSAWSAQTHPVSRDCCPRPGSRSAHPVLIKVAASLLTPSEAFFYGHGALENIASGGLEPDEFELAGLQALSQFGASVDLGLGSASPAGQLDAPATIAWFNNLW